MARFREDKQAKARARLAEARLDPRVRQHQGSTPRGNPPLDRQDVERGRERMAGVLGR